MKDAVITYSLPYLQDSRPLMLALSSLPRPVFLDSAGQAGSRYDILAADPQAWLQVSAGTCSSSDPELSGENIDFFNKIRRLKNKYLVNSDAGNSTSSGLPFQGGLLGFLGYPQLLGKSRLEIMDAFIGVYLWAVVVDHQRQSTCLVLQTQVSPSSRTALLRLLSQPNADRSQPTSFELSGEFQAQLTREQYDEAFRAIKSYIQAGDCYQVNLTQRLTATYQGEPLAAYFRLRSANPAPFSSYLNWGNGALLSTSPERFVQLLDRQVLTQPIKGTRPRGRDPWQDQALSEELLASEKDRAENLMIVDLLRNDLGRVCTTGSVKADQLFTLHSFSNVHHLVSSVRGSLAPPLDGLDLLQACFPGGSITGAPKLRAMEIIQELELCQRRVYCGTVFYCCASGNMDSSITIRSVMCEAGQLHCWAGGAIVNDSECAAEYAECFDKISNIIKSLSG